MRNLYLLILSLLFSMLIYAQEDTPDEIEEENDVKVMSLQDLVEFAVENNSQIKSKRTAEEISKIKKNSSFNVFYPQVNFRATISRQNELTPNMDFSKMLNPIYQSLGLPTLPAQEEQGEVDRWSINFDLSVTLNLSLSYITLFKMNKLQYQGTSLETQKAIWEASNNVKKQYYGLISLKENLKLIEEKRRLVQNTYASTRSMYNAGFVQDIDLLKADLARKNLEPQYQNLKIQYEDTLNKMKTYIGMDLDENIDVESDLEFEYIDYDAEELYETFYEEKNDIKNLEQQEKILKANQLDAIFSFMPILSISQNYSPTRSFRKGSEWFDRGAFAVTLSIPLHNLFPYSNSWNQYGEAKRNLKSLKDSKDNMKSNFLSQAKSIIKSLELSKEKLALLQDTVVLSTTVYNKTSVAYANGVTSFSELDKARDELSEARGNVLAEKINYINFLLDLESLIESEIAK